jgi:uncharacterized protein (DUF433 family)
MNWREYIHSDPKILSGKPSIKGTRLAVDFVLGLLAEGWSQEQLFENYPGLNQKVLQALFAYASECLRDESLFEIPDKVA